MEVVAAAAFGTSQQNGSLVSERAQVVVRGARAREPQDEISLRGHCERFLTVESRNAMWDLFESLF